MWSKALVGVSSRTLEVHPSLTSRFHETSLGVRKLIPTPIIIKIKKLEKKRNGTGEAKKMMDGHLKKVGFW